MASGIRSWKGSARNFISQDEPTTVTILEEVIDAIREVPKVVGVFMLVGILRVIFPDLLADLVAFVASCAVILLLCPVFGGEISAESALTRRVLTAFLSFVTIFVITTAGMFFLLIPGIYFYFRFFLAVPAALITGHGPFEALSESWHITDGRVFEAFGAYAAIFIVSFIILFPILVVTESHALIQVVTALTVGTAASGVQTYLYLELSESG